MNLPRINLLLAVLLVLDCGAGPCVAQSIASLPLEGWYRPGRYMPVRLHGPASRITADGAVTAEAEASIPLSGVVPLLVYGDSINRICIDGTAISAPDRLHRLSEQQRLVGVAGDGEMLAHALFPGKQVIVIPVDPLEPLPGSTIAWQTLDALVVDGPAAAALTPHKLEALLAGGMMLAVKSAESPDQKWPWTRVDDGWAIRPNVIGPLSCSDDEDRIAGVLASWQPDLSMAMRSRIALIGVLVSASCLGCLLLPRRYCIPGMAVVIAMSTGSIAAWRGANRAIEATGSILPPSEMRQIDRWHFVKTNDSVAGAYTAPVPVWPMLSDDQHPVRCSLALRWDGVKPRFIYQLPPGEAMAFVARSFRPFAGPTRSTQSMIELAPLRLLAGSIYPATSQLRLISPSRN